MPRICANARLPVPLFRSAPTPAAAKAGGRRHRAIGTGPGRVDPAHTAEALRARSLARREGPQWDAYAWCDRAPLGWEAR